MANLEFKLAAPKKMLNAEAARLRLAWRRGPQRTRRRLGESGFGDGADHDFEDFAVGEVYVFEDVEDAAAVAGAEAAEFGVGIRRG